jgi:hypothetical protein
MNNNIILIKYFYDNISVDTNSIEDLKTFHKYANEIIEEIIESIDNDDIMSEDIFLRRYDYYLKKIWSFTYKSREELIKFYRKTINTN